MTEADHGRIVMTADPDDPEHTAQRTGDKCDGNNDHHRSGDDAGRRGRHTGLGAADRPGRRACVGRRDGRRTHRERAARAPPRGAAELQAGESLAVSVRPRKVVTRYLLSLGMWELDRRATRFSVTDRRLLVEEGLFHRVVMAVPLSAIQNVLVRTGPWEGWVNVSLPSSQGGATRIGPLRSGSARRFAAAINRHGGAPVDEIEE